MVPSICHWMDDEVQLIVYVWKSSMTLLTDRTSSLSYVVVFPLPKKLLCTEESVAPRNSCQILLDVVPRHVRNLNLPNQFRQDHQIAKRSC